MIYRIKIMCVCYFWGSSLELSYLTTLWFFFNFKLIIIIKTLKKKTLKNNKVIIDHFFKKTICHKELTSPTHDILPSHIPFAGNYRRYSYVTSLKRTWEYWQRRALNNQFINEDDLKKLVLAFVCASFKRCEWYISLAV